MRVVDSERVLFVHVPKTGGLTIQNVLESSGLEVRTLTGSRHHTLSTILLEDPTLRDYWTFGFVRNPWARMLSWWSMIRRARRRAAAGDPVMVRKFERYPVWRAVQDYPDFEAFVLRGTDEVAELRLAQIDYLRDGGRRADFIGRTESMEEDADVVRKRLGLPAAFEVPHRNRTKHGHHRDYYTPAMRERVAEAYRADVEEFGYEF
jgi:hypothetical protein